MHKAHITKLTKNKKNKKRFVFLPFFPETDAFSTRLRPPDARYGWFLGSIFCLVV
jgi:hypothetical protein